MRTIWIAALVVLVDQAAKIVVVNTMYRGQSIPVIGDWFRLTFTENPGMAFGIELGHPALVTFFSIAATGLIIYYLTQIGHAHAPYRLSLTLVLGGAIGNIIDRVLYGWILYGEPLFLGRVVDFIHFNVWRGRIPDVVPFIGGHYTALFPIWNVADMAIVVGVIGIIATQGRYHRRLAEIAARSEAGEPGPDQGIPADRTAPIPVDGEATGPDASVAITPLRDTI
jgi:signal peptidase II